MVRAFIHYFPASDLEVNSARTLRRGTSFSGVEVMARLIEGEQPGALTRSLQAGGSRSLRAAIAALPPDQREALQEQLGPETLEKLLHISQEGSRTTFYESLLGFGVEQQGVVDQDRSEWAKRSYSLVAAASGLPALQRCAQEHLQTFKGQGPINLQVEPFFRHLARGISEPNLFFAMPVASKLFKMTRLTVLSRLATARTASFLTRDFGAQALASMVAFATEAPAFSATNWLVNRAMGHAQELGIASGYIALGGMKFTGWALGAAFNRLHGIDPLTGQVQRLVGLSGLTKHLLPHLGRIGGMMLGHHAEVAAGLRENYSGATMMADSLVMMLQRHAVGGPTPWELNMERRIEVSARQNLHARGGRRILDSFRGAPQGPLLAVAGEISPAVRPAELEPARVRNHIQLSTKRGDRPSAGKRIGKMIQRVSSLSFKRVLFLPSDDDIVEQVQETLQQVSSLPSGDETRERAVRDLASIPNSVTTKLLPLMVKGRPPAEWALLDEIMARRELSRFTHLHEILEHRVLEHILAEHWESPFWSSGVRFSQNNGEGEPISSLQVRSYTHRFSAGGLVRALKEAATQLGELQKQYPESRNNVIHVILRPEIVLRYEGLLETYFQRSLREAALSDVYKDSKLSRVSFLVDSGVEVLHYRNYRPVESTAGQFLEDPPSPDAHPL